jgi:hypothetical protein
LKPGGVGGLIYDVMTRDAFADFRDRYTDRGLCPADSRRRARDRQRTWPDSAAGQPLPLVFHIIHEQTRECWERARSLFYRAIELDPTFATPYGMLARCYQSRRLFGWFEDKGWDTLETKRIAMRVLEIGQDDALALSWAAAGLVSICREYDSGAEMAAQDRRGRRARAGQAGVRGSAAPGR